MLLILYFVFSSSSFAYAADVDSIRPEDHNHERLLGIPILDFEDDELELRESTYEAEFVGVDRGIIGRATTVPTALINNRMDLTNVEQGQLVSYMFSNSSLWSDKTAPGSGLPSQITLQGRGIERAEDSYGLLDEDEEEGERDDLKLTARQTSSAAQRTLYISVTTCDQPQPRSNTTTDPAPQLKLYVSQSANNTNPGPNSTSSADVVSLVDGYVLYEANATGAIYMGVYAEDSNSTYSGVYSAQIAASIDGPYHYYWNSSDPNLFLIDSDDASALLFTGAFISDSTNVTLLEEWMDTSPPFVIFASDADDNSIMGIQNSYCGLQNKAQIAATRPGQTVSNIRTGMTSIGDGTLPKQQFYVDGLSKSKTYNVILAMNGNSTASGDGVVGGGGQVFHMTNFSTLTDGNCAVIYDLAFCDQVAYSVPSNPNNFANSSLLAAYYDNATQLTYSNFKKVLALVPCETTASAQYSLARTCADCDAAYKSWLCSSSIPRCTDYSSDKAWTQPRALGQPFPNGTFLPQAVLALANQSAALNGSRNSSIDAIVAPGPYKEVLPCDEICYSLVQSCPASMGFNCPQPDDLGFNTSYGTKPKDMTGDINGRINSITCNYPGVAYFISGGSLALPPQVLLVISLMAMGLVLL